MTDKNKPYKDDPERKFKCHARRHMTPSQYKTYDAMIAMSLSGRADGICYASRWTIANHAGQKLSAVDRNIKSLVKMGWLVPEGQQGRRWGEWSTNKYYVMEHDEYPEDRLRCPLFEYNPVTGEKNTASNKTNLVDYLKSKRTQTAESPDVEIADAETVTS